MDNSNERNVYALVHIPIINALSCALSAKSELLRDSGSFGNSSVASYDRLWVNLWWKSGLETLRKAWLSP